MDERIRNAGNQVSSVCIRNSMYSMRTVRNLKTPYTELSGYSDAVVRVYLQHGGGNCCRQNNEIQFGYLVYLKLRINARSVKLTWALWSLLKSMDVLNPTRLQASETGRLRIRRMPIVGHRWCISLRTVTGLVWRWIPPASLQEKSTL